MKRLLFLLILFSILLIFSTTTPNTVKPMGKRNVPSLALKEVPPEFFWFMESTEEVFKNTIPLEE